MTAMTTSSRVTKLAATSSPKHGTLWLQMALDQKRAGRRLALLRESKRFTQDALTLETGISKRSIQRWENGYNLPRWGNLDVLSKALGNEVYDIFREVGVEPEDTQNGDITPDPFSGNGANRLTALEAKVDELITLVRGLTAEVAGLAAPDEPTAEKSAAKRTPRATGQEQT